MRKSGKVFWSFLFGILLLSAGGDVVKGAGAPAQTLNLPETAAGATVDDDYVPDVTARVSRISFIQGEVKIRRAGVEEWESAALNLPVIEGDEIVTSADSRVEIQFDNYKHLRLSANSYLKVMNLRDEGIAVSLSLGTLNLRITSFDKDKSYFEIDAPKTTVAVQRAGTYRIDAGKEGDTELRVVAMDGGEARVYSDNAGFTLKNGRSARVFIDGNTAGEWEIAKAERYIDEFDDWSAKRDAVIAKRLRDAYYDKYYDNDIYGADDLNDNGDWVYTRNYGYVWRPSRASIGHYANWSPYRYGHWRWMPPYGWIWVNDEPWGWATYHHGRWFYDAGYWYWSPYGYYRTRRSWWYPALVVINIFGNNVCWYPLPYHYGYYNYNGYYNPHYGGYYNNQQGQTGGIKPIPGGSGPILQTGGIKPIPNGMIAKDPKNAGIKPPLGTVPPSAVISVGAGDFGTSVKGIKTAPLSIANSVLSIKPDTAQAPTLPVYAAINTRISREIKTERPRVDIAAMQSKVGAAPRTTAAPLDNELRTTRVLGGRPPVTTSTDTGGVRVGNSSGQPRDTGAVTRPPVVRPPVDPAPVKQAPVYTPPATTREEPPVRTPRSEPPPVRQDPPVRQPPRSDPPPVRYDPPVRQPPPRSDPPPVRSDPPVRQPPRSDPPPVKSDPKPDSKPTKPAEPAPSEKKGKG